VSQLPPAAGLDTDCGERRSSRSVLHSSPLRRTIAQDRIEIALACLPRNPPDVALLGRRRRRSRRTLPRGGLHEWASSSVRVEISAVPPSPRASIWAARLGHSEIAAIPALPYSTGGAVARALTG